MTFRFTAIRVWLACHQRELPMFAFRFPFRPNNVQRTESFPAKPGLDSKIFSIGRRALWLAPHNTE